MWPAFRVSQATHMMGIIDQGLRDFESTKGPMEVLNISLLMP
jgi:hypothetical protein